MVNGKWNIEDGKWKMGIVLLIISILSVPSFAQNSQVSWSSFNGGFGVSSSENSIVTSSAGFSFSGETKNGSTDIISGFLADYNLIITDVKDKESLIPEVYRLNQNYPNPFNPSTKIKFSIPELSYVTIKIFDILGNEIETLINNEKPSGSYELTWNAGNLPSGIYFYQLKAGEFVETKKMILLK